MARLARPVIPGLPQDITQRGNHRQPVFLANGKKVLCLYATVHALVDAMCAAVVVGISARYSLGTDALLGLIFLYCALAFGLQPIFGLVVDALNAPRPAAVLGCLISAIALLLLPWPTVAIIVAGVGNATFHVGGGAVSLRLTPQQATSPGVFVALGAFGLLVGAMIGKLGWVATGPLLATALALSLLMTCVRVRQSEPSPPTRGRVHRGGLFLGFILFVVLVRSLVGILVVHPWKTDVVLLIALTLAVVSGKALGGVLADRWGWIRVGIGAMIAATPLLAFGEALPFVLVPGLLILNLTMPVTLVAITEAMPRSPAFAFGLTSLAVLLGAFPPLLAAPVNGSATVVAVMLLAALALYRGLQLLPLDGTPSRRVGVQE
jgi:MFS transporter, FSR family, fosmidomycin resistance protein